MHTHPKNDNCISSFMTTKKFDAIVEIAGKVDANYAAQIEGYCSLLGEYGKKFEAVCAMLALDLIGVKVFRYSDETAEAVASGEKLLKESGTIYESFADMMSPEDAKRYLDFLENGSREGLTSAELAGVEKADALLVSQKVEYEDVWDLRNAGDVLESGSKGGLDTIIKNGKVSIDDIKTNPSAFSGKSAEEIADVLRNSGYDWNYEKIHEISIYNPNADSMTLGKYFDGTIESGSYIARAELTGDTYFSLGTQWNDITQAYGLSDKEMFNLFNTRALDDAVMQGKKWETKWINFVFLILNDDVNHRAFSIDFEAYNYFVIRLNYDKGRFGCNIIFGEKLIALNNSQEWWDEADFDVFFMELQKELELRIPDKYLQAHGWL